MVDAIGHLAIALLWVIPVWFLWEDRLSLAFVALAITASLLPDVDLLLPFVSGAFTHSLLFTAVVALVAGAATAVGAERVLTRWWFEDEGRVPARSTLYVFAAGGLFVGGVSHLAADLLASTTLAEGVPLFWPILTQRFTTASIQPLDDIAWNGVLLVIALSVHVGLFIVDQQ